MANLPETPQWEDGIYQIEVSDPVLGGPDGITNRPIKQLASRTLYLKQQVEQGASDLADHIAADDPHTQYAPKESPTFTGTPTAPTPASSDNSKKLATTEFVARIISALTETVSGKLSQEQNGADIPDPEEFVKNLGLGDIALAGVSSGVLGTNGYIAIPMIIGGVRRSLIIQWGTTATGSGGQTVTLPTAFPTLICGCAGSESGDLTSIKVVGVVPKTLSTIAVAGRVVGASTLANTTVKWIVVGY